MKNILIVAAHPDDEVLGCGGSIARFAAEGNDIYSLILGEGVTSRDEKRSHTKRSKQIKLLKGNIREASNVLGIRESFIFDFPDNRFDTVPLLELIKTVEKIKEKIEPDTVFTHHHGDLNIDHNITFRAVLTAFRPMRGEPARRIYSFEVPSSTEWNAPLALSYFAPDYFVDISETLEIKINAMMKYKSETRKFPHPRSPEAIRSLAMLRGSQVGFEAAEAFKVVRILY